jgi:hypothetical protein
MSECKTTADHDHCPLSLLLLNKIKPAMTSAGQIAGQTLFHKTVRTDSPTRLHAAGNTTNIATTAIGINVPIATPISP